MRAKPYFAIAVAAVLLAAAASIASGVGSGTDGARATLPSSLERALTSSQVEEAIDVDTTRPRKVALDGTDVFLVSGGDGDACIGLHDGSAACGPARDVAAGRLFLITVAATAEPGQSAIPATGSTKAVVYGYQPDKRATRANIRGSAGQVLGSGEVVDGLYRVEITTDAHSRRMTQVRFGDDADAPAPINLDAPNEG
jgi:hypothetical protein